MAVPFSNTHLRVPRGFGAILEGLAREVLRDQPDDIPKYAADYFDTLLKQRDESGVDPVEWAAKLEDRFYNNHAFKTAEAPEPTESEKAYPGQETTAEDAFKTAAVPEPTESVQADPGQETTAEDEFKTAAVPEPTESVQADSGQETTAEDAFTTALVPEPTESVQADPGQETTAEFPVLVPEPSESVQADPGQETTAENEFTTAAVPESTESVQADPGQETTAEDEFTTAAVPEPTESVQADPGQETTAEDEFTTAAVPEPTESVQAAPEQETSGDETASLDKLHGSQTEDKSSKSAEGLNLSSTHVSEKVDSSESSDEEDEHNILEQNTVERGNTEEESVIRLPTSDLQSDEASGKDEGRHPTIPALHQVDRTVNETDSSSVRNIPPSEPPQSFSHSGFADVDVCASELGGTERTVEGGSTEVVEEVKSVKPQTEATVGETSLSQRDMARSDQQEVEDGADKTREEERTETESPSGQTHGSLPHIESDFDCNVRQEEESLVEISFEDVPEAQQVTEVQSEISEVQQREEPNELTASAMDQNIADAQEYHDLELEGVKKEVDSEGEKVERLQKSFHIIEEKAKKQNQEDKTVHKIEHNESEIHQVEDPEFKEEEMTDVLKEADKEDAYKEGCMEMKAQEISDGGAGNNLSQATQPSTSVAPLEADRGTLEKSAQDPAEEDEGSPPGESQPGDPEEEKEATSKEAEEVTEDEEEEEEEDAEVQESTSDAMHAEEEVTLRTAVDHQGGTEENPAHMGSEECSRPQEEEDIMDIPLDDPEANRAAAKIQAGFRGHMTRKKMKPEDKVEGEERQEDRGQ